jgi:putative membrane protein
MRSALLWLAVFFAVLIWSGINPHDYFTWFLEVVPALVVLPVLIFTRARFPLTPLAYALILIHAAILMVGGHYTYAEVPLGNWLRDALNLSRNHYDKLGHLAQGFVPAMLAREILIRNRVLRPGAWLAFVVTCICLAVAALYEIFEWLVAEMSGTAADDFLGTQGYVWDTQSDMLLAGIGAVLALATLSRLHNHQIARMG